MLLDGLRSRLSPKVRATLRDWLPPVAVRRLQRHAGGQAVDPSAADTTLGRQPATEKVSADALVADHALPAQKLEVIEVDEAEFLVGDLFRRRFNTPRFPGNPRHFVALAKIEDGTFLSLGYVHHTMWSDCALCGGLVIDNRAYRRLLPSTREAIRQDGGIAEILLRRSFALLPSDLIAIWGYVGDKQAEQVDLRVGFRHTNVKHVMVVWRRDDLSESEKADWIRRVADLGPF